MRYIFLIVLSLLVVFVLLLRWYRILKKHIGFIDNSISFIMEPSNIEKVLKLERKEIERITTFFKDNSFEIIEDVWFKDSPDDKGFLIRYMKNDEIKTIVKIHCRYMPKNDIFNNGIVIWGVNVKGDPIYSSCSMMGDSLPKIKKIKGYITRDFKNLDKLLNKYKEFIRDEELREEITYMTPCEIERLIGTVETEIEIKEGVKKRVNNKILYTDKTVRFICLHLVKNTIYNKVLYYILIMTIILGFVYLLC